MEEIKQQLKSAAKKLFDVDVEVELTRPDEQFGDYSTNVALQLAKQLNKKPREIAETIADHVRGQSSHIRDTEVAGPGFINIWLTDTELLHLMEQVPSQSHKDKVIVAEYSDPNPFKVLHAGHLYTSIVGDAIANLFEIAGADVHRVNFGGDVGLHVGKTMWAILKKLGGEHPDKLVKVSVDNQSQWLTEAYIEGNNAYEDDEATKAEIIKLNKRVYELHSNNDSDSSFAQIYWTCRQWSYDYFNEFYKSIGVGFEKYYPESEVAELGLKTVKEQLEKGVFEKSDGAVIFPGEKHNLHARVFINSEGLPTYEAKDIGLILQKYQDYKFDTSLVITGNEQAQYMQVVVKALEQFEPELAKNTVHLTHGIVRLKGGEKMSSRKGNILRAVKVLDVASEANKKLGNVDNAETVLGAVKYAFLKQGMGADIIYDPEESVAIQGNSGPYLQYAHARACSILSKVKSVKGSISHIALEEGERNLLRKIGRYSEVVDLAVKELMPHHICTYLYELAQNFNRFYESNRVVGDEREQLRAELVRKYADVLKEGLGLLGIVAPEKM